MGIPTVVVAYADMLSVCQDASKTIANSMPYLRMVGNDRNAPDVKAEAPDTVDSIIKALTDPLTDDEKSVGEYVFPEEPYICSAAPTRTAWPLSRAT
jgi:hypothetical protein